MVRIGTLHMLAIVGVASWAVPVWEYATHGAVSLISIVTATMFTAMLVAWPFLTGRRLHGGHAEKAVMCRDCHNLRWPNELALGFCIHCGSVRPAVAVSY